MAELEMNDMQRQVLRSIAEAQAALGLGEPGVDIFGYVEKPPDVTHDFMEELVRRGFVADFLATGYGEVLFYRLTDVGQLKARERESLLPLVPNDGKGPLRPGEALLGTQRAHIVMD